MSKRILKRLLVLFIVMASSLILVARYRIPLGLDLRGGVQISLHVLTDDALKAETEAAVETIRQEILKTVDKPTKVLSTGIGQIRVTGISLPMLEERLPGWESTPDTESGIPAVRLRMGPALRRTLAEDATAQAMRVIENRLNRLGVHEITIQRYGDPADHQIQVQVPGEKDPRRIQSILESPGLLQFRIVDSGPFESAAAVAASYDGTPPAEVEILPSREGPDLYYAVQRSTSLTGRHLRAATSERDYGKLVSNLFTSVFVSRTLFECVGRKGPLSI